MTLEAGRASRLELSPETWEGQLVKHLFGFTQHFFQVAVYGVKVNSKQRFYSLRCEPAEGQAAGAKALVFSGSRAHRVQGGLEQKGQPFPSICLT